MQEVKKLDHYPSASAIEYLNGRVYIIGDDANSILVLDSNLVKLDSITLYHYPETRIPKYIKPDLEAITRVGRDRLLITGSASIKPQRYMGWLIETATGRKDSIRLDSFYTRVSLSGIQELNIEGSATISGALILSNRGNNSYRKNHLVITLPVFWNRQSDVSIRSIFFGANSDTSVFNGVSGLCYAPKKDKLIATVSTENTTNAIDDGAIGKSYLWIVKNISSKTRWKAINPDQMIDLEKTDERFRGQKIESACVLHETEKLIYLLLVADNDDGSSTLFKLVVPND